MILVTGPPAAARRRPSTARSRRSTRPDKKIITIEDPVESTSGERRESESVKPQIGLTFANGLRSIVRQDPDVIMVGEIRDPETAEIAVQAALTGHLVFSTLHTNDAAARRHRLLEMGVEDYLLASSLLGVLAQRLVRKVCLEVVASEGGPARRGAARCRRHDAPPPNVSATCRQKPAPDLRRPPDARMLRTGYRGRSAFYELC